MPKVDVKEASEGPETGVADGATSAPGRGKKRLECDEDIVTDEFSVAYSV